MFYSPHQPASGDRTADKECEAEQAEADHQAGLRTLSDSEDDRGKK